MVKVDLLFIELFTTTTDVYIDFLFYHQTGSATNLRVHLGYFIYPCPFLPQRVSI